MGSMDLGRLTGLPEGNIPFTAAVSSWWTPCTSQEQEVSGVPTTKSGGGHRRWTHWSGARPILRLAGSREPPPLVKICHRRRQLLRTLTGRAPVHHHRDYLHLEIGSFDRWSGYPPQPRPNRSPATQALSPILILQRPNRSLATQTQLILPINQFGITGLSVPESINQWASFTIHKFNFSKKPKNTIKN
jgi:hypothetical protein